MFWREPPACSHFPLLIFFSLTYWAVNSLMHWWSYSSLKLNSWADAEGNNGLEIKRILVIHRQKSLQQAFVAHWVFIYSKSTCKPAPLGGEQFNEEREIQIMKHWLPNDTEGTHHMKYCVLNRNCNTVMYVSASQSHSTATTAITDKMNSLPAHAPNVYLWSGKLRRIFSLSGNWYMFQRGTKLRNGLH